MATVVVGWSPRGVDNLNDDGGKGGTDGSGSDSSVHVVLTPMDGLTVVAGTGEKVNGTQMDDLETIGLLTLMDQFQLVTKYQKST